MQASRHHIVIMQNGQRLIISFWHALNPLRAKFFRGNINIFLHFMSLLHIDVTHVLKIRSQVRPGPTYST